jgi:uncharacterized coiled-coil DUF342 family protein|tara:strand:- start:115 stop:291 length:177 start_codon:yes stop_codon:yes gene_type:complete
MKFITDFLNKRKENKVAKKIATLQERAMQYQRNGNLREYANIVKQIEELEESANDKAS